MFANERQRVQFALLLVISAYTGSRPGAVVPPKLKDEPQRAILYEDIELVLMPGPKPNGPDKLVMLLTLKHLKSNNGRAKPYVNCSIQMFERANI